MASPDPVGTPEQVAPPPVSTPEKASPELSAPSGWQKKVGSSKKGSASKKDVYFIAPDGEEIKNKRLLDRYLKSHPGGPASSEFDWSTGETPTRRSSRLSTKMRPSLDSPKSASAEKRRKKTVDNEKPRDEEKGEPEEVPPEPSTEKKDEIMENVEESEVKPVEEAPVAPGNGQEAEPKVEAEAQNTSEPLVEDEQVVEEQKTETTADTCVESKEPAKEDEKTHESSSPLPKEESTEQTEGSDKIPNVFQHCPEAPNASRQVDGSMVWLRESGPAVRRHYLPLPSCPFMMASRVQTSNRGSELLGAKDAQSLVLEILLFNILRIFCLRL
ncbi:hypothetical protein GOP47_0012146 [Adiantum capillus-veneris]|uniref:MBD domain-containing protein n=1 Tax=Adiantum capillus-veneris TaxID=13818 RepID=A0A9D4ZG87_ADICA|nr:hypothetical protein GOP47_0012146 [Adiantum capillus-veneris]